MLKLKKYNEPIANAVGVAPLGDPQTKNISNKCIANAVGTDASVRPHFEEHTPNKKSSKAYSNLTSNLQPLTSKTGITLIALIITIIVMLILVGVTINVALNGGLFDKAKNAATSTQREADREELLSAVVGTYDSITAENVRNGLGTGWTVLDNGDGTLTCSKGTNVFIVNKTTGEITEKKSGNTPTPPPASEGNLSDLEKYIFGADGQGRILAGVNASGEVAEVAGILDMENFTFLVDPDDSNSNIYQNVKFAYIEDDGIYIRYGRDIYKFSCTLDDNGTPDNDGDDQIITAPGTLALATQQPEKNEGKYVSYKGKIWIVLSDDTDNSNQVELISADTLGSLTLGDSLFENARMSYNNAIETIVDECKRQTEISSDIRNVGGPAEDSKTMNETVVFSNFTTFNPNEGVTFEDYEGPTNGLKEEDTNYIDDYNQMKKLGILISDNLNSYWLATRYVHPWQSGVEFCIRYCEFVDLMRAELCFVSCSKGTTGYTIQSGVRPVVKITLDSSQLTALNNGDGMRSDPIQF